MDWRSKARKARSLAERQRFAEAADIWRELTAETHSIEPQYDGWLLGLASCLVALERPASASLIYLYLRRFDDAMALLGPAEPELQAHVLEQRGEFHAAAELWERAGSLVAAAISFERAALACAERQQDERAAQSLANARRCYQSLLRDGRARRSGYAEALVLFNLGQCCVRENDQQAYNHLVAAQRHLEEAADTFETAGERERAFDCYQVLLEMGRRSGAFENLAEGYINCLRILRQDNLKYYALQYYEDFLQEALEWREYHAAASLYREAADYCRRSGMPYDQHYLRRAVETWQLAADKTLDDGGAVELAENALLAAVECATALDDFAAVGSIYGRAAGLDLGERKVARYRRIAERYREDAGRSLQPQTSPEYLRQARAYPQIWHTDLLEWERDGRPDAVCASVVAQLEYPEVVRRRALRLLLMLQQSDDQTPARLAAVAEGLGDLQVYAVLSPLEALMSHPSEQVQCSVMRALRFLFFKRSFSVLNRGLQSSSERVREAAMDALGRLHFNHAFDPMQRIYRQYEDVRIRSVALESIGRISSIEAGDFLLQVLREEKAPLRSVAKQRLMGFDNREFLQLLRQQHDIERGPIRQELADILRNLEGSDIRTL